MPDKIFALLGIDVEEEGLFGGRYAVTSPRISNTAHLFRLRPFLERGMRPTLFCAYSAFADASSLKILEELRDHHNAEIGAHLHHWNTPPLTRGGKTSGPAILNRVPAFRLSAGLLDAKLRNLFQAANDFQGGPVTTFRMGRWDLHATHWPLLCKNGVTTDASVRPLHCAPTPLDGPDHFNAPANPYWVKCAGASIMEVPLTATPLFRPLRQILARPGLPFRSSLRHWAALALWPVQQPLWLMKLVTRLYVKRGGKTVQLTWHSSEMMPGGAPHMPDEDSVNRFLLKVDKYMDWLEKAYSPRFATIGDMRTEFAMTAPAPKTGEDWLCADPLPAAEENSV